MKNKNGSYTRRSITIPTRLQKLIEFEYHKLGYSTMNDLIIELLELGLLKIREDETIKDQNEQILTKLELIYNFLLDNE